MEFENAHHYRKFTHDQHYNSMKKNGWEQERIRIYSDPVDKDLEAFQENLYDTEEDYRNTTDSDFLNKYRAAPEKDINNSSKYVQNEQNKYKCTKCSKRQENTDPNEQYLPKQDRYKDEYAHRRLSQKPWRSRNDSGEICAILQPDLYVLSDDDEDMETKVRKTKSRINWAKVNKKSRYHRKCGGETIKKKPKVRSIKRNMLISDKSFNDGEGAVVVNKRFNNVCYCKQIPEKPRIRCMRHKCDPGQKSEQHYVPLAPEQTYSADTLREARKVINYPPKSEFLKRLRRGAAEIQNCRCHDCWREKLHESLQYTDRRDRIEKAYDDLEEERKVFGKYAHKCIKKDVNMKLNVDERENVSPRHICYKIDTVNQIRKKNYFDTHSTENLSSRYTSPHRCIHKFELDARFLPKPLNADVYGTSRCTLCNKPMEFKKKYAEPPKISSSESKISHTEKLKEATAPENTSNDTSSKMASPRNGSGVNILKTSTFSSDLQKVPSSGIKRANKCISTPNLENKDFSGQSTETSKVDTVTSFRTTSLTTSGTKLSTSQRKINIGNGNDLIDLKIGKERETIFRETKTVRFKPNVMPTNSLALRYQKGVI